MCTAEWGVGGAYGHTGAYGGCDDCHMPHAQWSYLAITTHSGITVHRVWISVLIVTHVTWVIHRHGVTNVTSLSVVMTPPPLSRMSRRVGG